MRRQPPPPSDAVQLKLKNAGVARLATVDAKGKPHVVPICFVYDGSVFYTAIDRKPKRVAPEKLARLDHIRRTPHVALLIDEYNADWSKLWYILVRGQAQVIPDSASEERVGAFHMLEAKYPQYAAGMLADDAPVIRISPERITSWGKV